MGKKHKPRQAAAPPAPRAAGAPQSRLGIALAGLLVLLGVLGAAWWWRARPIVSAIERTQDQNVLVVTIDTLRADTLALYGGQAASPNLNRLAARGVRFDFAHAHAVVTLPSHASILTGLYPYQHGIRENSGYRLPSDRSTLASMLKPLGYSTGAFVAAFPVNSRFGLGQGFDLYDDQDTQSETSGDFRLSERPASTVVSQARRWIGAQQSRWFAWVHAFEPHAPYRPPPPFDTQYAGSPYVGEAAFVDHALGPLFDDLSRQPRPTLVIVTSDHGEGLGDHGEATHGLFAYEPTLKVPLVVAQVTPGAGEDATGQTSAVPAFHVDIVPTVLDAVGATAPTALPGRSLLEVLGADEAEVASRLGYFEAMSASLNRGWAPLKGVLAGREKLVDLPIVELYDLGVDPGETDNRALRDANRLRVLEGRLRDLNAPAPGLRQAEDPETVSRLRALGYVTGSAPRKERYTEEDDPKRLVDLDRAIFRGIELYETQRWTEAVDVFRSILGRRPDLALASRHLAFVLWELGRPIEAIDVLKRAMAAGPVADDLRAQLGMYLAESGEPREAVRLLEPGSMATVEVDLVNALAVAYARAGMRREALGAFSRLLQMDPNNAIALQNVGALHLENGDLDASRDALERALRADARLAGAHTTLGVVELKRGNRPGAYEHWKQAIQLDPNDWNALYNLASELSDEGQFEAARPYLERFVRSAPRAFFASEISRFERLLQPR